MHCWKEIGDFQIICSKVGGFRPFNYLLGVTCYLLPLKCKWLVLNKLCNFTAYKLFVSTNKQLTDPMDSMADPLFSSYSVPLNESNKGISYRISRQSTQQCKISPKLWWNNSFLTIDGSYAINWTILICYLFLDISRLRL